MSWAEQLNPFTYGTVAFFVLFFLVGVAISRFAHHIVRTTRFSKIRRYGAQRKVKTFNQINHPKFSFLCGQKDIQYCKSDDLNFCHKFLNQNFPGHGVQVPQNLCSLWIPRDGFTCGTEFQDFKPHEGRAFESFLTYQMISDRSQVTWYNLRDGRRYVAGVCIYLRLEKESEIFNPPIEYKPLQKSLEMWYDYTPQKRKPAKYACIHHGGMVKGANIDKILAKSLEEKSYQQMGVDANPNPPDYTALLMEDEEEAEEQ